MDKEFIEAIKENTNELKKVCVELKKTRNGVLDKSIGEMIKEELKRQGLK